MGEALPFGPGDVIAARYRVVRALGSGGMGAVFEAENLRTGRRVAVKTLHTSLAGRRELIGRFEREARAASGIVHPNIVDVLDLGDDPARGVLFLVLEFLEGDSLAATLDRDGPLSPRAALDILAPIADALAAVHAAGLVHRDVKPDNVFLRRDARGVTPKLIDFGIVKRVDEATHATRLTHDGMLVGTPAYMSPEQARGDADVDARTDVWSLGVVLFEALSGQLPIDAPNANLLLGKLIYEQPRSLAAANPSLPPTLVAAVDRALRKDREARWATMRDFGDALRHIALRLSAQQFDDRTTVMPSRPHVDPVMGGDARARIDSRPMPAMRAQEKFDTADAPTKILAIEEPTGELVTDVRDLDDAVAEAATAVRSSAAPPYAERPHRAQAPPGASRAARLRTLAAVAAVVVVGVGLGVSVGHAVRPRRAAEARVRVVERPRVAVVSAVAAGLPVAAPIASDVPSAPDDAASVALPSPAVAAGEAGGEGPEPSSPQRRPGGPSRATHRTRARAPEYRPPGI